jgi:hypothetical protein
MRGSSVFNYIVVLFLLSLPFVSAFSITSALTLPLLVGGCALLIGGFFKKLRFNKSLNLLFLFFVFIVIIAANLNMEHFVSNKPLNHILSFLFCFFIYFTIPYSYLSVDYDVSYKILCKIILLGVIVSAFTAIFEFTVTNVLKMPFDLFPRPAVTEYEPLSIGGMVRARGFAEESGHFALYLISMYLCVFSYVKEQFSKLTVFLLTFLVVVALFCSFSVSGILFSVVAIFSTYLLYNLSSPIKFIYMIVALLSVILILEFTIHYYTGFSIFYDVIYAKLNGSASMTDRSNKLDSALYFLSQKDGVLNYLFGFGPAFYETYNLPTLVTLYPLLYVQFGIIGLLLFLTIVAYPVIISNLNGTMIDKYLFCSYFYSLLFFAAISNYWFPWFWVILSIILVQSKRNKVIEIESRVHSEVVK